MRYSTRRFWMDLAERALTAAATAVAALQTAMSTGAISGLDWKQIGSVALTAAFWAVVNGLAASKTGDPNSAGFVKQADTSSDARPSASLVDELAKRLAR